MQQHVRCLSEIIEPPLLHDATSRVQEALSHTETSLLCRNRLTDQRGNRTGHYGERPYRFWIGYTQSRPTCFSLSRGIVFRPSCFL